MVKSSSSGLVGFKFYQAGLGFYHQGRYLIKSVNIWPDLLRSGLDFSDNARDFAGSRPDLNLNKSPERLKLMSGSGFMGFERGNPQPTTKVKLERLETASDHQSCQIGWQRVGHMQVGWVGQVGGPLRHPYVSQL